MAGPRNTTSWLRKESTYGITLETWTTLFPELRRCDHCQPEASYYCMFKILSDMMFIQTVLKYFDVLLSRNIIRERSLICNYLGAVTAKIELSIWTT